MLTAAQIRFLRGEAHHIEALYQIGKNKLGQTQLELLENGLKARELIKVKVLKSVELDINEFAEELVKTLGCEVIDIKDHIITLFKAKAKESRFKLPK